MESSFMLLRNFIDTKALSWPLAPHLEMTKVGKLTLYLSPDIPERKFSIDELLAEVKLSKKQTKLWAAYFRDLASELDSLHDESNIK